MIYLLFEGAEKFKTKAYDKSMVAQWLAHLPLVLEVQGLILACGEEKFLCLNTLSLVSFAGMTLNTCAVLWFGTLTGCPLCSLKNPMVI